jgi:hypothetical protein
MASLPIVKHFNIVKDLAQSLLTGVIRPAMNEFHFKRVKEAFGHSIVPAILSSIHTALATRSFQ